MGIVTRRKDRECVDFARAEITVTAKDAGTTIDFAGVLSGFTIVDANITVVEAFDGGNKISVGLEDALTKFVAATTASAVKGAGFSNVEFKADKPTSVYVDISNETSTTGKAIVSITYAKNASSRTDY